MLLLLPPEIREKIYVLVCTSELSSIPLAVAGAHSSFPSNFLLTSSVIYHEVRRKTYSDTKLLLLYPEAGNFKVIGLLLR